MMGPENSSLEGQGLRRAAMTAGRVFHATKHIMPDNSLKKQMEKGVSTYEELRQKIKGE